MDMTIPAKVRQADGAARRGMARGATGTRPHAGQSAVPAARLMHIDEHALCRNALADLVAHRSAMRVVAATGDPEQALPLLLEHQPDLLVMEQRLAQSDGLMVLARLRAAGLATPTVIFTTRDAEPDLGAALRAGVRGFLLKEMDPEDVVTALGRAACGELALAPSFTLGSTRTQPSRRSPGASRQLLFASLTGREREILEHLSRGETNKVIGRALAISHDTVKLHVRHILAKLRLGSRVEAAVFAMEQRS